MAGRRRRRRGRTADCKPRGDLVPRKMKGNYRAPNVTQIEKGQSKHTQRWTLSCVAPLHSAFRPTPSRERKKNKTKENRLRSPRKITKVVQVPPPPSMKIIFVFVFFLFLILRFSFRVVFVGCVVFGRFSAAVFFLNFVCCVLCVVVAFHEDRISRLGWTVRAAVSNVWRQRGRQSFVGTPQ